MIMFEATFGIILLVASVIVYVGLEVSKMFW